MSKKKQDIHPWVDPFAKFVTQFGKSYNGFELHGVGNVPKKGAGILVFYHSLVPLDLWYAGLQIYLETGRLAHPMADRFLFQVPVMKELCKIVGAIPGNRTDALKFLKRGELIGVCPGGVKEAISGTTNNYKLFWENRTGFADLAIQAKVPIIPAFTVNSDELYRAPFAESNFFQSLYQKTRLPLVPIIGLGALPFPAKLSTWLGKPITAKTNETKEQLAKRVEQALKSLIDKHQPLNANPLLASWENFRRRL